MDQRWITRAEVEQLYQRKNDMSNAIGHLESKLDNLRYDYTRMSQAARKVVDARYYNGDDGWEKLKDAIGELEDIVGRTE